jgi:general stress protein YciG
MAMDPDSQGSDRNRGMGSGRRREVGQRGGTDRQHSHPARSEGDRRLKDNLDPQTRSAIGRKGGAAVSGDRAHMAAIGRKGGERVAREKGRSFYSEIGRKGGEARAEELGHAGYAELGRKGGETVARERGPGFYSEIGRKGGEAVSGDREHMAEIGRRGGEARGGHSGAGGTPDIPSAPGFAATGPEAQGEALPDGDRAGTGQG